MSADETQNVRMSIFGVGPLFVAFSLGYTALALTLRFSYAEIFTITCVSRPWLLGVGCVLVAIGIAFFVSAMGTLRRGFPTGRLFTGGVYAMCRHPVYGAWVVFIVPGMVLIAANWAGLLVPLLMYVTLRVLVRKEDEYLERTFGDEYRSYRSRTPAVFFLMWRR